MSSINLIGNLLDPNGLFSVGDKVKFTHQTTTGETIKSAVSIIIIPPDGSYNLNLQYGLIKVEYRDVLTGVYKTVGVVTVNGDSVATTLPQLLSAITPPTPPPGAVTEAPVNGKTYGRMDAGWIEIISGSSGVEEAPIDGNRYSRSDESWVVPKMQDATDAELNIVVGIIPEQGLQWDYGSSSDSGKWFSSSPSNTGNGIKANPEDKNGVVTNLMELDGYIVDILTDDMGDFLNVTLEAIDILGVYTLLRFNGIPSVFASGSITILDAGVPAKEPLQDGDVWKYNSSEQKFKPTQIESGSDSTDFKMEDATDADRNLDPVTNLDPDGYRFKVSPSQTFAGDITPQRLQGWWSNVLDLDNKTIPLSGLDGVEVDVYYDNNAPFRVTMLTNFVGVNAYSWDGIGDIRPLLETVTDVKFVPVDAARVPLQDGDAWVYNGSESKFKPTPTVPTVVVTEFPASPDANTLYIKVV